MVIELLYELFTETSPFYLYLSMVLSAMAAIKLIQFDHLHEFTGHGHVYKRKTHAIQIHSAPIQEPIGEATEIMDWIVKMAKRIDAPDDDKDDHAFSFFKPMMKKRGGQLWNDNLCSLSRKNIA
ncbi:hypothetical protein [Lentibacillus salicampi]|uniref:Uncharacterized protein n=1 Tax=Lentibacillus salicampi TaxID=175306 RepID=A0A4Y9A7X6_9BACI|nr:hypothetical protein [Lentibacillus salicampi]TFJ91898.1 hypothetical protein E4U82_15375 [Lentibacillus salicampi]